MELVRIEMLREDYEYLVNAYGLSLKVIDVKIKDDFFKDDEVYKQLKKKADKSYKELEEYQFKKRNNIKD